MDARHPRFEELYRAEFDHVYRYATTRLGRSDGEEVTADVFHAAAIAFADGDGDTITGAWLMAVTKNKVVDRWRRAERRRARAHLTWSRNDTVEPFPDHWSRAATRVHVIEALDQIPDNYRAVLLARHVDEMSVLEVADLLGISVRAAESVLARARRAFRRAYRRLEGTP